MPDRYRSFRELAARERESIDWQVRAHPRRSAIAILAPHGGKIAPGTSDIAEAIAGEDFSFYGFEGIRSGHNTRLELDSKTFDEPECSKLLGGCTLAISILGLRSPGREIKVSGGNALLRERIVAMLLACGFEAIEDDDHADPADLCNRPGPGLRLEIAKGLRDYFESKPNEMDRFVAGVRAVLLQETIALGVAAP